MTLPDPGMTMPHPVAVTGEQSAERAAAIISGLEAEIGKVVVGQHTLVRRLLTGLFAAIPFATARSEARAGCGHILLEGVPGVAKTLTATTLAHAISARFQRIQLTPDLLPADILGTRIYDAKSATFRIEQGPIFTNILLADEINRATPKTQSALLEAMQERQVTLADTTFPLDDPFWVLATQNPVEQEGVYALPEAQLDRFSMMLRVEYPSAAEEVAMLHVRMTEQHIDARVSPSEVTRLRAFIGDTVFVDDKIMEYIVRLGRATRAPGEVGREALAELVLLGVSPRSYQHVLALARVTAFMHGRTYVLPADVKEIYCDASRHRIARTVRAEAEHVDADEILTELLRAVPLP
jgi:MoxR-like ATPase